MTNLDTEFTVGGTKYLVPPLHWHWHRKAVKEYLVATKAIESLAAKAPTADNESVSIESALSGLEEMVPLIDAGLAMLHVGLQQKHHFAGTPELCPSLEELGMALTQAESIGMIYSVVQFVSTMNPEGAPQGEAGAAATTTQSDLTAT